MMAKGGIDVLLIAPTAVDALVAPLKKIYDSGVQIITVDTYLGYGDYSKASNYSFPLAYIGTDNELGGKQVAEHLAKLVGEKGKVFMENTNPGVSSVQGRLNGFKAGIAEFPNMTFVGVDYCMDVQQKAMDQVAAALQKDPDIVGVFGANVFTSQGAYQAVVNAGLTGAVKIASWDATETLIAALKAGQVDLVLAQKPAEIGSLAVDWAFKFITQGVAVPKKVIPGFEFFTKDNVDSPDMQQWIYKK
jgi:ribose transport system substrate-binding protein